MNNTPETNNLLADLLSELGTIGRHNCPERLVVHARKLEQERDEAREAIPAGEWVAYKDHQKVHDAASRLLVAIYKQLLIGSFSLIIHEYNALKDAIYGKEGAK
jgi:hypothetical protein